MKSLDKLREIVRQREVPTTTKLVTTYVRHGHALPYHDRDSLEVAINHARVIRARTAAQRRLRDG